MNYSEFGTKSVANYLQIHNCLIDLNNLILNEGCTENMPYFTNNESVINMDCVERLYAKRDSRLLNKSMDCAILCSTNAPIIDNVVLIEFRFNYKSMRNIDRNTLLEKVSGSILCLGNLLSCYDKYYFIFDDNIKQQAIRRFRNMLPSLPNNYVVLNINELRNLFF